MKLRLSPPAVMLTAIGLSGMSAAAWAESKEVKPAEAAVLGNASVFAGPNGESYQPNNLGALPSDEGLAGVPAEVKTHRPMDSAMFWATLGDLKAAVKNAKSLTVYRGVTRKQLAENGGKISSEERKLLFRSDGQWFRTTKYPVSTDMAERLREAVFTGARNKSAGLKLCGDFHADVRLKWEGSVLADTEVLICFVCQEIKIYGTAGSLYGDLSDDQAKALREMAESLWREGEPFPKGPVKFTQ